MPYRIDPLHPDRLVCETCQAVVSPVPLVPSAEPIDPALKAPDAAPPGRF
jgi:hypothetical protein